MPTIGSVNLVTVAANMAKAEAQRRHNFKMARTTAYLTTNLDGVELSEAKSSPDGATSVDIKVVEQAWLYGMNGSIPRRTRRIPSCTLGDLRQEYGTSSVNDLRSASSAVMGSDIQWYIQGTKIYTLNGENTAIALDVIQWMPEYTGSNSDFFLKYHYDWLIMATVEKLNLFLKEDQRVAITNTKMEQAWKSVAYLDDIYAESLLESGGND